MIKQLATLTLSAILFFNSSITTGQTSDKKIDDVITFTAVDPLKKVLKEESYFPEMAANADVARGEHASFQFVVRSLRSIKQLKVTIEAPKSGTNVLKDVKPGFISYIKVSRATINPSVDKIYSPSGYYPDAILPSEENTMDVRFAETQPIWITVKIPAETAAGLYSGKITISGTVDDQSFTLSKPFTVNVFPVLMNSPRLMVTNWYFTDPATLAYLNDNKPVVMFSEQYWGIVRMMAKKLKEYYQTVIWVSPLDLTKITLEKGKYKFDYTNFDKTIKIFLEEGINSRIEGTHLGGRTGEWTGPYAMRVAVPAKGDSTEFKSLPLSDMATITFYNQFLPALMGHVKDKGWDKIYVQHIADEPVNENAMNYNDMVKFVRKIVPEIKLIDAIHTTKTDRLDIWVPQLNYSNTDKPFFMDRIKDGDEVWIYTCLSPKGEYPNRFLELPLIKTRLIHWLNYKYGFTGYLHWGWNYWITAATNAGNNPMEEGSGMMDGSMLPGGDSWIVYPYKGKILSSIRLEAMRDGIADYELLKMLEAKDPAKAKEMCAKAAMDFTLFNMDIPSFRKTRTEILNLLSK